MHPLWKTRHMLEEFRQYVSDKDLGKMGPQVQISHAELQPGLESATWRRRSTSSIGVTPNCRLNWRLNCEALS